MFVLMTASQLRNWVSWDHIQGHQTKSKEYLVNTPIVMNIAQFVCLGKSFGQVRKWVILGQN